MGLHDLYTWFAGGPGSHGPFRYMPLTHCMAGDTFWITLTVVLDLAIAAGYVLIALHWRKNQRTLDASPARRAMGNLRDIFILCGLCGYLFIPIKLVWPAWRLYDAVLAALAFYTWRYAWSARDLKVVINELGRSTQLAADLEQTRAESRRKSFFLNALSHDLRTPLNGLILQAQLAEIGLDADDPAMVRESLAEIRASIRLTSDMLDGFLEVGKLDWSGDSAQLSRFALDDLLREVARGLQAVADQKRLALTVDAPAGLTVQTDRPKLERILLNLVNNALKFTDVGGVRIEARARGNAATVTVADTGIGIEPEHREQLFQEFFQVHNRERNRDKGYGLGLAIAGRLAQQLGGRITVDSVPGQGSRFTVHLPDPDAPARPAADPRRQPVAVAAGRADAPHPPGGG